MFLRFRSEPACEMTLSCERVELRAPRLEHYAQWAALRSASREFLQDWEPAWPENELEKSTFRRRLRRYAQDMKNDRAYPFFLFSKENGQLIGGLTLSNIRRGVAQTGTLGYWMGAPFSGMGYMGDAVRCLFPFAFKTLRLHRLEAACLPHNSRSIALLERNGFQREGFARRYLRINSEWRDHVLYARLEDDVASLVWNDVMVSSATCQNEIL